MFYNYSIVVIGWDTVNSNVKLDIPPYASVT